jgi:transcription elongation GreA/GreB family factor
MAKALLKKTQDDEVDVERPAGKATFVVLDVKYAE